LKEVYDTRELFDEQSNTSINYLFNWLVKAIVPIALIYFLIHIGAIGLQLLLL
jgi:hypothetical protein